MRRFKLIMTVLIYSSLSITNLHAESQKSPESSSTKQHEEILSGQTQTEEQFNRAECFDKVWQIINEEFWDPNFNGVDWEDAGKRFRPKALVAKDHESFAEIINQMLAELKTSHTRYFTKWDPDYYTLQATLISQSLASYNTSDTSVLEKFNPGRYSSEANPHRVGIGVVTKEIDGRHYVTNVLASSPAEKASVVIGDWIVQADGRRFHPIRSFQNKAGEKVELIIQSGHSESTRHSTSVIPLDKKEKELFETNSYTRTQIIKHKGHHFTYMPLCWLSGWKMREVLDKGLGLAFSSEGIIIDIRDGFGGGPVIEYIEPFLQTGLEGIVNESHFRGRKIISKPGFNGPVIVLINRGSRSGKELLAYYFKKTRRGILLGERTAGYVSGGSWKRISDESMLYYCRCMLLIDGKRLEGVGVEPDIEVPFDIRFAAGRDIQLERAKDEMVRLIDTGKK